MGVARIVRVHTVAGMHVRRDARLWNTEILMGPPLKTQNLMNLTSVFLRRNLGKQL